MQDAGEDPEQSRSHGVAMGGWHKGVTLPCSQMGWLRVGRMKLRARLGMDHWVAVTGMLVETGTPSLVTHVGQWGGKGLDVRFQAPQGHPCSSQVGHRCVGHRLCP